VPVAPDVWRLYRSFGVNLKQSYGPAELAGLVTVHRTDPVTADTVGFPAPGTEIRIAENGEVQARGETICLGYDGDASATRVRATDDGWWRTGDAGAMDPAGRLSIHDRLADVGQLADGTRFVPGAVEAQLRRSRFIGDVLAFGDGRQFVAALIAPLRSALGEWAEQRRLGSTSLVELVALPDVGALIREELRACNARLPAALHVRRFLLLDHPLESEDVEARLYRERFRSVAMQRHAGLVDALFRDPARSTEVPDEAAAHLCGAVVEDVEGPFMPRLEPAHA
jgi:long-chain acyl-CoA synthetase